MASLPFCLRMELQGVFFLYKKRKDKSLIVFFLQNPKWDPKSLEEVDNGKVEAIYEPLSPNVDELVI